MKYFNVKSEDFGNSVWVVFNCNKEGQVFINYLKTVLEEHEVSRLYCKDQARWWRSYEKEAKGYSLVYGRFVEVDIVRQFMELMED